MDNQNDNSKPENEIQKQENNIKKNSFIESYVLLLSIFFWIGIVCLLFDQYFIKINFIETIYLFGSMAYIGALSHVCLVYLIFDCLLYKHRSFILNIIDSLLCLWVIAPVTVQIYYIFITLNISFENIIKVNKLYCYIGLAFSFFPLLFYYIDKEKNRLFHILRIVTRLLMLAFIILYVLGACAIDPSVNLN